MWDTIIVGIIVAVAVLFAGYRLFFKRSCGCGHEGGGCCQSAAKTSCCSGTDKNDCGCGCGK